MRIGILGGGLSGLSLGSLIKHSYKILEKNSECGGLCRTLHDQGFTFDYGGCHIVYSKDDQALEFILGLLKQNKRKNKRKNKILYKGHYVKYPFENGLRDLPLEDNFECINEFIKNLIKKEKNNIGSPNNFHEWCTNTFGDGIASKYLVPYNEKIWKYDLTDMSTFWIGERLPNPPIEDIIKSSLGIETEGYTHQLYYYYPITGGIQAVIDSLTEDLKPNILTGFDIKNISKKGKEWQVSDNKTTERFDQIVSTIPIFDLIESIEDVPVEVKEALKRLKYNRLLTVLLGVSKPRINDYSAIYIPDKNVLSHRLGMLSNFSSQCAPKGYSSILAEITCPMQDDDIWQKTDNMIIDRVMNDLIQLGIVNGKKEICYTNIKRSEYAYVIYDMNYKQNMKIIKDYINKLGITLLGRFSEFEYLNMDACIRRAMNLAERLNVNEQ
ncbi:MAG: FAD-dependent oxidoreductase [Candidatus Methanoperedens sp.]